MVISERQNEVGFSIPLILPAGGHQGVPLQFGNGDGKQQVLRDIEGKQRRIIREAEIGGRPVGQVDVPCGVPAA